MFYVWIGVDVLVRCFKKDLHGLLAIDVVAVVARVYEHIELSILVDCKGKNEMDALWNPKST